MEFLHIIGEMFPESGIKIVSIVFRTHIAGRQVRLRHIREGEEIGIISEDNYYDPGFQQSKRLLNEVIIMPGDDVITECVYDTQNRTWLTLGGFAAKEEVCLAYILYYPRTALSSCTSMTPVNFFFETFGIKEFYNKDLDKLEKQILEFKNHVIKVIRPLTMQSLFFNFSEKNGFNLDYTKKSPAILKAMVDMNLDEDSIFSQLIIYKPDEFQNKSMIDHLRDLPWHNDLFTHRVEEILNKGKHKTFCKLQNNLPAMPNSVYNLPTYITKERSIGNTCKNVLSGTEFSKSNRYFGTVKTIFFCLWLFFNF